LSQLKGTQADVNRSKLKESIEQSKLELENRLSDKRNLDHLVPMDICGSVHLTYSSAG
jgi:hypothetical protein